MRKKSLSFTPFRIVGPGVAAALPHDCLPSALLYTFWEPSSTSSTLYSGVKGTADRYLNQSRPKGGRVVDDVLHKTGKNFPFVCGGLGPFGVVGLGGWGGHSVVWVFGRSDGWAEGRKFHRVPSSPSGPLPKNRGDKGKCL